MGIIFFKKNVAAACKKYLTNGPPSGAPVEGAADSSCCCCFYQSELGVGWPARGRSESHSTRQAVGVDRRVNYRRNKKEVN